MGPGRPTEKVPTPARPGEAAPGSVAALSVSGIVGDTILGSADVGPTRERRRLARLRRLVAVAALALGWIVIPPQVSRSPHLPPSPSAARARDRPSPSSSSWACSGPSSSPPCSARGGHPTRSSVPSETRSASTTSWGSTRSRARWRSINLFLATRRSATPWAGASSRRALRGAARDRQDLRRQSHGQRSRRPVPLRLGIGLPVDVLRADQPQDPVLLQGAAQPRPQRRWRHRLH